MTPLIKHLALSLFAATSLLLTACGSTPPAPASDKAALDGPIPATVLSVRPHQVTTQEPSGVSTAVGAAAGGLIGNQMGKGKGKVATTIAGVVGGALIGSQVNQHSRVVDMEALTLLMPDGKPLQIDVVAAGFQPGQRVLITVRGQQAEIQRVP